MLRTAALTSLLLALSPLAAAQARAAAAAPWATINVCDSVDRPNMLGIRGSMPALHKRAALWMRFRVQYRDPDGRWRSVTQRADSGWVPVATADSGIHDAGWSFSFRPPETGGAYVMRGYLRFEWRARGDILRRAVRVTEAGHPDTVGADPPGTSAATCEIA